MRSYEPDDAWNVKWFGEETARLMALPNHELLAYAEARWKHFDTPADLVGMAGFDKSRYESIYEIPLEQLLSSPVIKINEKIRMIAMARKAKENDAPRLVGRISDLKFHNR